MQIDWEKVLGAFEYSARSPLIFNSGLFLVLFLVFYGVYINIRNLRSLRTVYVILFSLFFYYKSSGLYFVLLIFSSIVDFYLGQYIYETEDKGKRKLALILSMCVNLGLLGYFKYTNFFLGIGNDLFGAGIERMDIFLPIGISFYTFQTMSYSIDLYRRSMKPAESFLDFMFFVSFFPQLVAGPIVRASDFIPQIRKNPALNSSELNKAFVLIIGGLIKKAVISDYISVNFVDRVFDNPMLYSGLENLMAVYGYAIQIYCDFSGYSDMAIGLALLMGFNLPVNFNKPYLSTSITDFWRRWHISLSSWLRDYLYIPLGGNRHGKVRTYVNLFLTMLLGGLWHGASWNFILWGAMHGTVLGMERFFKSRIPLPDNLWVKMLRRFYAFHVVAFCWIFFRASDFNLAKDIISQIFSSIDFSLLPQIIPAYSKALGLVLFGFIIHWMPKKWEEILALQFQSLKTPLKALLIAICCWIVWQVSGADVQPFIYFQF
ncbi:MBOAT family O-acyltransferase [Aureibacter tunicatorum]|uniref:D-alanyl-lipoteichoic acid acyltransferase DltB (MBOAT superfamily) n=1 Tax=Aureibacter tunicatorum TaxID=866807 RepID=A0AAE3XK42_9BACT|nr:MBOAT family protein [Aureibacter tunicatorum]MDR6239256.1 D-alanyl-lipoteichoic acid acyltransferase DltB (MBOAT superfamily) [Aureibacter tunicatorum]BDD04819.1 alginate O-acetyltransferase [Aureibacter tunicatorum]